MPRFREVLPQVDLAHMEQEVLQFWKDADIFKRTLAQTSEGPRYVFYEGPPTANGRPGIHHVLARVFKDIFPRYKTMRGFYVLRKGGWDTHGLPVELEIERKLGFSGKRAIEDYGIANFNQKCRESVFEYVEEWKRMTERIGYWVDLPESYITLTADYVESLWWILKQYWNRDLIYRGHKVVPYCPRCGTPLSSHELALGYQEGVRDPSIYVKFPLRDRPGEYLLVWTTTPWTLPGNAAVAVGHDVEYVLAEVEGDKLWIAGARLEPVLAEAGKTSEAKVLRRAKGKELLGWHYRPLYAFLPVDGDCSYVIPGDFVSTEDGTGIVHIAPAFGADDLAVGQQFKLPTLMTVDPQGRFIDSVMPWRGLFVKDADPLIQQELSERGLMFHQGIYEHTYPFCWRCDTPLLYYARSTWYIKTTAYKDRLLSNNDQINWVPEHIRDGRFGNWLENNVDWGVARERYWGTPLPFWVCEEPACGHQECIGSVAELGEKTGRRFISPRYLAEQLGDWPGPDADGELLDLHRPAVDGLTWPCVRCGSTMRRVPEVADAWFDSGSMPVAQWHYPYENHAMFSDQFPADFICEAIDQTRGWFYTLHAVSTLLFDQPCFQNVICLGHIVAEDGSKMSKSRGNVVDPWSVLDVHGADATRWYMYTASPPGNTRRFSANLVKEVVGRFLLTLWNSYSFFVTYANLNDFDPGEPQVPVAERPVLDRWVLAALNDLVVRVTAGLETYDVTGATRPISEFVEELSNWYVRLSRRRFWNVEPGESNKRLSLAAHQTLYEVLVTLSQLAAPFTPFIADEIYRNLAPGAGTPAPESVHLSRWPAPKAGYEDEELLRDMALAQRVVSLGRAAREGASLKLRQPLAEAIIGLPSVREAEALKRLAGEVMEELNVKALRMVTASSDLVEVAIHPLPKQLGSKYGRRFPAIREALLNMDPLAVAAAVEAGEPVEVTVDGEPIAVQPDEIEIRKSPKPGLAVAEEAGYLVAVKTELTDELRWEGLAREVSRNIQELRKKSGFAISDRIETTVASSSALAPLWELHGAAIAADTLSVIFREGPPVESAYTVTLRLDGEDVLVGIMKA